MPHRDLRRMSYVDYAAAAPWMPPSQAGDCCGKTRLAIPQGSTATSCSRGRLSDWNQRAGEILPDMQECEHSDRRSGGIATTSAFLMEHEGRSHQYKVLCHVQMERLSFAGGFGSLSNQRIPRPE